MIFQRRTNDLKFSDIPISEKTYLILIGTTDSEIYFDKIELKKSMHNSEIQVNMKKITKKESKRIFN